MHILIYHILENTDQHSQASPESHERPLLVRYALRCRNRTVLYHSLGMVPLKANSEARGSEIIMFSEIV